MAADDIVKVDAIVVGGGPAGLVAALTMIRSGLSVILMERGEYSGSKNVGGLLYGSVLNQILPGFYEKAPIERPVSKRSISFLGEADHVSMTFGSDSWSTAPFNHTYVVHRSQFDRWLSKQVEEAGVDVLEGTVVDELIYEGEGVSRKVTGVRVRGDESFFADVVVLAEGANALLSEKAAVQLGLRPGRRKQEWGIGAKEIISLPRARIEDRFGLNPHEGAALDFIGSPFAGLVGGGFIYTGKEAVHVGFAAKTSSLEHARVSPSEALDRFKAHPRIRPLLQGGELLEYSAHVIPEGGYDAIGELAGNGLLIVGDAAGLVNMSLYKEGTNHAMESGRCAGETVVEARKCGDFTKRTLAGYRDRLDATTVMKDLKKYADLPDIMDGTPNLFSMYPQKAARLLVDYFTITGEPKAVIQKRALRGFLTGLPKLRFVRDVIRARKLC